MRAAWKTAKDLSKWALGLVLVSGIVVAAYRSADNAGRVMHNRKTPVWIQGDWSIGEYRDCDMPPGAVRLFCGQSSAAGSGLARFPESVADRDLWAAIGAAYNRNAQADWSALDHYFRTLRVRFYGRFDQQEQEMPPKITFWRCQRNAKRLVCRLLN